MAIIKKNEFKQLDLAKVDGKIKELREKIMKVNFQRSTKTTPDNPGQIKEVRRTIARLLSLRKSLKKTTEVIKEV